MKRAVIFVPHQDDETNLTGNILAGLVKKYDTHIVYSSLETEIQKAQIRKDEAINACAVYGVSKEKIMFLNYPDTPNRQGHHYFTDGDKSIIRRLEGILLELKPQIIIGTDFDFHADHRMLSLALDEAVLNVLRVDQVYSPLYLKGFCYETAYYGVNDYSAADLKDTAIKSEILGNVSYEWKDRISIKSNETNGYIFNKIPYKALKCHKSQYAILHARSVINSDNVFWRRRTDNLLLRGSTIKASSGNTEKLADFKVIDTDDIITYDSLKIDYSKGLWSPAPSDSAPHIEVNFEKERTIRQIIFHGSPMEHAAYSCNIEIILGEGKYYLNQLLPYGQSTDLALSGIKCNHIDIFVHTRNPLSEIEIFENKQEEETCILAGKEWKKNGHYIDCLDKFLFNTQVLLLKVIRKIRILGETNT